MSLRAVMLLLISLVLAGLVAVWANKWMSRQLASSKVELTTVVAASKDIPFATRIDETMVKTVRVTPEAVPEAAFKDKESVIGQIATVEIIASELLLKTKVVEGMGDNTLAAVLEEGMRAITVPVNDVAGVGGFVRPGNRVDLVTVNQSGAQTLLSNLRVLAVNQETSIDKQKTSDRTKGVRTLTLEVTPEQAEIIIGATNKSKIHFTLRNPLDTESIMSQRPETTSAPQPGQLASQSESDKEGWFGFKEKKEEKPEQVQLIVGKKIEIKKQVRMPNGDWKLVREGAYKE